MGQRRRHHTAGRAARRRAERSAFVVLWKLPGGAPATVAYLQALWQYPRPFVADETFALMRDGEVRTVLNPTLPPPPDGTEVALVRTMLLIDDTGAVVPSNVVQSIQVRAFPGSAFSELRMSRTRLFAGHAGGLRAVGPDERDFVTFSSKGMDPFESGHGEEPAPVLDLCVACHDVRHQPAIVTVQSLGAMLRRDTFVASRHERWARWSTQPAAAATAKVRSYEWGVLQGLWQALPR